MNKIRVAIVGYGNLGRGVEKALSNPINDDLKLVGIFTRRSPETIHPMSNVEVFAFDDIDLFRNDIDVAILCGGSATDLPEIGPKVAKLFNTVDSFDTHAKAESYYNQMDTAAWVGTNVSIISVGWDPGLFSIERAYANAILPNGTTYTFWGHGVSQGHSDAIRRISGVKNAIQYTVPVEEAVNKVLAGENPKLETKDKHIRVCYVVAEEGADQQAIADAICNMPNYFKDYETHVHFISEEELKQNHSGMPHGGMVIHSGNTGDNKQIIQYSLKLDSNPEFTGSVLVAYARAAYRISKNETGAKTVFDVPISYLYADPKKLIKTLL